MPKDFITYLTITNDDTLAEYLDILDGSGIEYQLENNKNIGTGIIEYDVTNAKQTELKIKKEDFEHSDLLIEQKVIEQLPALNKDYPLLSYSVQELQEIITEADKWSKFDYYIAKQLLQEKGHSISAEEILRLKNERIQSLAKPEKTSWFLIFWGYFLGILGVYLVWYVWLAVGLIIGVMLRYYQKTLPNGDKVYNFSENTRKHGLYIIIENITLHIIYAYLHLKIFGHLDLF